MAEWRSTGIRRTFDRHSADVRQGRKDPGAATAGTARRRTLCGAYAAGGFGTAYRRKVLWRHRAHRRRTMRVACPPCTLRTVPLEGASWKVAGGAGYGVRGAGRGVRAERGGCPATAARSASVPSGTECVRTAAGPVPACGARWGVRPRGARWLVRLARRAVARTTARRAAGYGRRTPPGRGALIRKRAGRRGRAASRGRADRADLPKRSAAGARGTGPPGRCRAAGARRSRAARPARIRPGPAVPPPWPRPPGR